MRPVTYLIAGAGDRGHVYAGCAKAIPDEAQVVGVAEPRDLQRSRMAEAHGIPSSQVFSCWREAAAVPRFADAVVISTQDQMHAEPAVAFADLGYQVLLEKPMAICLDDCEAIVTAVKRNGTIFGVGHVLRYTPYFTKLKSLLDEGAVGDLVTIQHLEPVGYWHQAHSFVRGNWRNEDESTFMLMAKSCHDLDLLRWMMGRPCLRLSSFGSLHHFRAEKKPEGASDRCLDCDVEASCPYSAKRLYLGLLEREKYGWPLHVITDDFTEAGVTEALRNGPYGRCVYACDNDVVDHQVVNMEFEGGRTATFTMTAFSHAGADRRTQIFGTHGELSGDGRTITHRDFLTAKETTIDTHADLDGMSGHGGGDDGFFNQFTRAVAKQDPSIIRSGPDETLESHRMVFAAEEARRTGQVVELATGA